MPEIVTTVPTYFLLLFRGSKGKNMNSIEDNTTNTILVIENSNAILTKINYSQPN